MRVVLDPNVLVSALLAPVGAPARLIEHWLAGTFELVVSKRLLEELGRTLEYRKIAVRVAADDRAAFVTLITANAEVVEDPTVVPSRSPDADDDYLLALAEEAGAVLVSGDRHLLELSEAFPVLAPRSFLDSLEPLV